MAIVIPSTVTPTLVLASGHAYNACRPNDALMIQGRAELDPSYLGGGGGPQRHPNWPGDFDLLLQRQCAVDQDILASLDGALVVRTVQVGSVLSGRWANAGSMASTALRSACCCSVETFRRTQLSEPSVVDSLVPRSDHLTCRHGNEFSGPPPARSLRPVTTGQRVTVDEMMAELRRGRTDIAANDYRL